MKTVRTKNPLPEGATARGASWDAFEVKTLVRAYFGMLDCQTNGTAYSKAATVRHLMATDLPARSRPSIECKLMNVSGCLSALGYGNPEHVGTKARAWLKGYKPAMNYQRSLMAEVCAHLGINPDGNPADVPTPAGSPLHSVNPAV